MKQIFWGQKVLKPSECKKLLEDTNTFIGQRKMKPIRVEMLKRKMEQGLFRGGEIAFGRLNGHRILLNGQHQLAAAVAANITIKAMVQEFQCDTEQDLARCYTQFDIVPKRTEREIVQAFATGTKDECSVDQLQTALRGLSFLLAHLGPGSIGFTGPHSTSHGQALLPDERAELLNLYRQEALFVIAMCFPEDGRPLNETRFMRRAGPTGAMVMTWRKSRADAKRFWEFVRDGEQLLKNDPSKRLRDALMGSTGSHGGDYSKELYAKCIQAWNAWREGREIQVLKGTLRPQEVR